MRLMDDLGGSEAVFSPKLFEGVYGDLGIKFPLNHLWIEPEPGYWDLYLRPQLILSQLVDYLRQLDIKVRQYLNDLDRAVKDSAKRPAAPYRVRFQARVEADKETAGLSARATKSRGLNCITLQERLFLEVLYFKTTGGHLDEEGLTRCDGSRTVTGEVPFVGWYPHPFHPELRIDYYGLHGRIPWLRPRLVVAVATG